MENTILALLTIGAQFGLLALAVGVALDRHGPFIRAVTDHSIALAWLVAVAGTGLSLFYSDIKGFEPCTLCWVQRIFLYPQVILLGLALWKGDHQVGAYSLGLSVPGALVAGYHYYGQMVDSGVLSCRPGDTISPCAQRFVLEFGYVTIPMMSLTAFVALIALMRLQQRGGRRAARPGSANSTGPVEAGAAVIVAPRNIVEQ
jgi:disulfide bond formation protein DsbB